MDCPKTSVLTDQALPRFVKVLDWLILAMAVEASDDGVVVLRFNELLLLSLLDLIPLHFEVSEVQSFHLRLIILQLLAFYVSLRPIW